MNKREIVLVHLIWILHLAEHTSLECSSELSDVADDVLVTANPIRYLVTITEIPHHVLVAYNNLYCSGALVNSRIVLTAASCLVNGTEVNPVIKLGVSTITAIGQLIPVIDIKIHEYYKHLNILDNDIAILVLKKQVTFSSDVKKAVLMENITVQPGRVIEVSGWGSTNLPQVYVNHLLKTQMVVIDGEDCKALIGPMLTRSNFCARYPPTHRLSDNGGAAVVDAYNLVGILSFGGTREDEKIAILTNVSHFHRWIQLNVQRMVEKYCVPGENKEEYLSEDSDDIMSDGG